MAGIDRRAAGAGLAREAAGAVGGAARRMITVPPAWRELQARLEEDPDWHSVFVLGRPDSGKTTLCRFLGAELAKRGPTAAIDCDPGQSALGVPTTLALAWEPWQRRGMPVATYFVGATSPAGHFLQMLTGTSRLADRARELGAERIVFDSAGYAETGAFREFHFQTLDLLRPDRLVALQRGEELELLLANFGRSDGVRVHRLAIEDAVSPRSRATRRTYRREKLKAYFANASSGTLSLKEVGFHGRVPAPDASAEVGNRLIALCGPDGFVVVLGIAENMDPAAATLRVTAPHFELDAVTSVSWGAVRLDRAGRELPDPRR